MDLAQLSQLPLTVPKPDLLGPCSTASRSRNKCLDLSEEGTFERDQPWCPQDSGYVPGGFEAGLWRNPKLRVPGLLWDISWEGQHILQGDSKFRCPGGRMGSKQLPMFQLKVFLKLCLQEAFVDISAVREMLEVGQVSCSPAELPVVVDLAGPSRPRKAPV